MAISKKLEIIYHNGQPDGIRSIRRHLSTMTTYVIPRPLLSEAKKLTGINRPGIYYLISETDDNKIAQIYVGQTRNGVSRLDDHNRSKDFWNKAIMFLADNKTFSLDMLSGLEAFAIGKAIEAKRYKVENTVNPKYEIDEYDLPLIEEVYEEKFLIPLDSLVGQFNGIAGGIDKKIDILSEQIRLLTEARNRLLPKLMSGELEV